MNGYGYNYQGNQRENLMTVYQKPKYKYPVRFFSDQDGVNKIEKKKESGKSYSRLVIRICKLYLLLFNLAEYYNLCHVLTLLFNYWYSSYCYCFIFFRNTFTLDYL